MTHEQMVLMVEAERRREDYKQLAAGLKKARGGYGHEQSHLMEFLLDVVENAKYDEISVEEAKRIMRNSIHEFRESLTAVEKWIGGEEAESNFMFK